MKYVVTYRTVASEKRYANSAEAYDVKETMSDSFEVSSLEACKNILIDVLDVPIAELSLVEVKQNFSTYANVLSEEKAIQIQGYYNGRLALYNAILKDLNGENSWHHLEYEIPKEYIGYSDDCMTVHESAVVTIERA